MDIIQRGSPNLLKKIREGAKQVSIEKGIAKEPQKPVVVEGGAYNSIKKQFSSNFTNEYSVQKEAGAVNQNKPIIGYNIEKNYFDRLVDTLHTVSTNKEYYNAIQAMFSLYSVDKLQDSTLKNMNQEDIDEIKSIIREFLSMLDNY